MDDYKERMDAHKQRQNQNNSQLSAIFSQFAGREVDVLETPLHIGGKTRLRKEIAGGSQHPVVTDMNRHARSVGLKLEVTAAFADTPRQACWPEVIATVEKHADGKYRISPTFEGNGIIDIKDFLP